VEAQLQILEGRLGEAVDAQGAAVAEALGGLMESLLELPPDVPPELAALVACAAALPERLRLEPGVKALARGLAQAWRGEEVREDEAILRILWEIGEFIVHVLAGRGFMAWRGYLAAAEVGEDRWKAACRGAQNRRWAYRQGLAGFFDRLFRGVPGEADPPGR